MSNSSRTSPPPLEVNQIFDETFPPTSQPNFIELYNDLKTGFQNHIENDPNGTAIQINARTFRICWTKSDFETRTPIWGEVEIQESPKLRTVEGREDKQRHAVVELGIMDEYPLTQALVYYSYANDMLYYYPLEAFSVEPRRSRLRVFSYGLLGKLVEEFQ